MGFDVPLWRAIAVFRAASLVYSAVLAVHHHEALSRPWLAWSVLALMVAWTVVTTRAYARPRLRTWRLLTADLAVSFACLFATAPAATAYYLTQAPPLSGYWFAGSALAASVIWGRRGSAAVALLYGFADIALRVVMDAAVTDATARGVVLLLLTGLAVGYMANVAGRAEERFARAVALEARIREREQLARSVHDSVLQVLALVSRRGAEVGGEAAELGRMAGEQEVRLRSLFTDGLVDGEDARGAPADPAPAASDTPGAADTGGSGTVDLRDLIRRHESVHVTVAAPATAVALPAHVARELAAAVAAALDNVARHCPPGTPAWVLVEDEDHAVTVSVRDEGPGFPPGRLEEARRGGRLGVAQSVVGRLRDLGGTAEVVSGPEEGTEVELRLPRERAPGGA
ncbi:MacS family sensor histidine kinase [Nocardiopsis sp. NPDC050513]|uniref:MacS family sensor histidine kinase n=1 Tax=Nocardiopsis sp. NPDC050513 TaxID=3364338 RepID=UPI003792A6D0